MTTGNALNLTFAANQLIYASSSTTLAGLSTATNGILTTSAGGVPSISQVLPILVQENITALGTITSIGAPLSSTLGGTGVDNSGTITLGGNLSTVGNYPAVFNLQGSTSVIFPTSGILATTVGVGVLTVSGTLNRISCTGGQNPVLNIDPAYVGQSSITTLGTIGTGTWVASTIDLAHGGTNANLTASNGGIFYSTGSAAAILSGTATANKVLLSGSNTTPAWSTAIYPASTVANQILYSSANNIITGLSTATDGVLITSVTGVPSISTSLPAAVQQNITELGSISYMVSPLSSDFGGTGVDNNGATITLGGSLTTIGTHTAAFTFTGDTAVTFPTSGTLATVGGLPALPLVPSNGGTGIASPTAHGILVAEGNSAFNPIVLGAGQLLIGTTVGDPIATTLTQGNALTITSATGAVTIGVTNNPTLPGVAGMTLPMGNTAARAGTAGTMRFNTQTNVFEGTVDGSTWSAFTTASLGVLSVGGTAGFITSSGGTTPIINIDPTYIGQSSITTVGTITTGTWTGSTIGVANGGTGATSLNQYGVLLGNGTSAIGVVSGLGTSGYVLTSNGAGVAPTWQAGTPTGVTSNIATANQTTVSSATGAVTIGLASNAVLPGTGGVTLPQGNSAAQAGTAGTMRFNTQTAVFEGTVDGATWHPFSTAAGGVVSVGGTTNRITSTGGTTPIIDIDANYIGQNTITTLGTITTGTWNGNILSGTYGGTGVNNGSNTLTLGGNLTTSGAYNTTITVTGATAVTLPVSGTLVNTGVTTLSSLASIGTITTGVWNGTTIAVANGGTGITSFGTGVAAALGQNVVGSGSIPLTTGLTASQAVVTDASKNLTSLGYSYVNTGSYLVQRDSNGNVIGNNNVSGTTTTVSSGTGVTMTGGSTLYQVVTGSSNQTFTLPDATTLFAGWTFTFNNNSTGIITIKQNGGTTLTTISAHGYLTVFLLSNSTSPGTWDYHYALNDPVANSIASFDASNQLTYLTGTSQVLITSSGSVPSFSSTLPTAVQGNITQTGTITNGAWNGSIITGTYGGTGVNNGAYTITLGGSISTAAPIITSGAYGATFTFTNTTAVTFPTSGTLQVTSAIIDLAHGGTNANLTASNGGIFYSTASAGAILSGTATANQILMSGSSTTPAWSTATYPTTTTASNLLYSNGANTVTGLATANSGVLITSSGGVPSISSTLPTAVQGNITQTGTITTGTWTGSTIGVANGGTGIATTTPYSVICAGTTATGAFESLSSLGTSGQVLTSNGASALPSWQAGGGGGSGKLILITSSNASSSASIDFTGLSSTYQTYLVVVTDLVPASNAVNLYLRMSTNNGSSYDTSSYYYASNTSSSQSYNVDRYYGANQSQIIINDGSSGATLGNGTGQNYNAIIWIYNPSNAALYKHVNWTSCGVCSGTEMCETTGGASYNNTSAVNAISLLLSSGNIASGTITLFGVKNS